MNETFDFYEALLDGLGFRFLLAVEQTVKRFLLTRKQVLASLANSASGLFLVFLTTSSIVSGKIIFTLLLWLVIVVGQVIGANEPIVANDRLKNDARSTRAS